MALLRRSIEPGDLTRAGFASKNIGPGGFHVSAQRGDQTKPGDDNTTHSRFSLYRIGNPFRQLPHGKYSDPNKRYSGQMADNKQARPD
jgi:hypothetical protein